MKMDCLQVITDRMLTIMFSSRGEDETEDGSESVDTGSTGNTGSTGSTADGSNTD